MANRCSLGRWRILLRAGRFDCWFYYKPSVTGNIWLRTFGITICRLSEMNHGERGNHLVSFRMLGWYFGTRLFRKALTI